MMNKKQIIISGFSFLILLLITISILSMFNINYVDVKVEEYEKKISLLRIQESVADISNQTEKVNIFQQHNTSMTINNEELNILNHSSFIDTLGHMHVIGKVKNNTPNIADFVSVKGLFYDNKNKVVGISLKYTEPRSLNSSEIASFDLVLQNASIPITQIENYTLRPVWD